MFRWREIDESVLNSTKHGSHDPDFQKYILTPVLCTLASRANLARYMDRQPYDPQIRGTAPILARHGGFIRDPQRRRCSRMDGDLQLAREGFVADSGKQSYHHSNSTSSRENEDWMYQA